MSKHKDHRKSILVRLNISHTEFGCEAIFDDLLKESTSFARRKILRGILIDCYLGKYPNYPEPNKETLARWYRSKASMELSLSFNADDPSIGNLYAELAQLPDNWSRTQMLRRLLINAQYVHRNCVTAPKKQAKQQEQVQVQVQAPMVPAPVKTATEHTLATEQKTESKPKTGAKRNLAAAMARNFFTEDAPAPQPQATQEQPINHPIHPPHEPESTAPTTHKEPDRSGSGMEQSEPAETVGNPPKRKFKRSMIAQFL